MGLVWNCLSSDQRFAAAEADGGPAPAPFGPITIVGLREALAKHVPPSDWPQPAASGDSAA